MKVSEIEISRRMTFTAVFGTIGMTVGVLVGALQLWGMRPMWVSSVWQAETREIADDCTDDIATLEQRVHELEHVLLTEGHDGPH